VACWRIRDVRRAGAVCVHGEDLVVSVASVVDASDERESGGVRRPVRVVVERRVVRDPRDAAPVGIHRVDLEGGGVVPIRSEGD
jgi:hypothetical protein